MGPYYETRTRRAGRSIALDKAIERQNTIARVRVKLDRLHRDDLLKARKTFGFIDPAAMTNDKLKSLEDYLDLPS